MKVGSLKNADKAMGGHDRAHPCRYRGNQCGTISHARNTNETVGSMRDTAARIATIVNAAGSTGQTAGEMLNVDGILSGQSGDLRARVSDFITQMRAA